MCMWVEVYNYACVYGCLHECMGTCASATACIYVSRNRRHEHKNNCRTLGDPVLKPSPPRVSDAMGPPQLATAAVRAASMDGCWQNACARGRSWSPSRKATGSRRKEECLTPSLCFACMPWKSYGQETKIRMAKLIHNAQTAKSVQWRSSPGR